MPAASRGKVVYDERTRTTDIIWPEFSLRLPLRWREYEPGSRSLDFRCLDLPDQLTVQRIAVPPEELRESIEQFMAMHAEATQATAGGRAVMTDPRVTDHGNGVLEAERYGVAEAQRVQFALLARGERSAILFFGLYRYSLERVGPPIE